MQTHWLELSGVKRSSVRANSSSAVGAFLPDERRKIARDLHDGTSQTLTAMQLLLGRLRRMRNHEADPLIDECERAIREVREHIRSLNLDAG